MKINYMLDKILEFQMWGYYSPISTFEKILLIIEGLLLRIIVLPIFYLSILYFRIWLFVEATADNSAYIGLKPQHKRKALNKIRALALEENMTQGKASKEEVEACKEAHSKI